MHCFRTDEDRSDSDQDLYPWSLALMKDWKLFTPQLEVPAWTDMVMTRARNPNLNLRGKKFDTKIGELITPGGAQICCNPKKHNELYLGSAEEVETHKATCWTADEIRLETMITSQV